MAEIGTQFLGGLQAGKSQVLGDIQTIEGVRSLVAQRDKTKRIQGLIGQYGEAAAGEKRGIEEQLFLDDPARAQGLRQFRTEGEATMAQNLARDAVITENALGTPDEPQAMIWFSRQATDSGMYTPEQVQGVMSQYSGLMAQDPAAATDFAAQTLDRFVQRGTSADDMLGERRNLRADIAEEQRTLKTTLAEEERGEKKGIRLEGIKQKGRLELERLKQEGKAEPIRAQKIADNMRLYGLSERDATAVADGLMKVQTDPLSGQPSLVNVATGVSRPITETVPDMPAIVAPDAEPLAAPTEDVLAPANVPDETVFDILGSGVGLQAVTREAISTTLGQVFEAATFEETTKARTKIRALSEKLIFALSQSSKPPVVEQLRLMELLPDTGIFESESHARAALTELHSGLSRQLIDDLAVANDSNMSKKARVEAQMRGNAIKNMLRELGNPPSQEEFPTITTQEEYDALESGAKYISDGKTARKP